MASVYLSKKPDWLSAVRNCTYVFKTFFFKYEKRDFLRLLNCAHMLSNKLFRSLCCRTQATRSCSTTCLLSARSRARCRWNRPVAFNTFIFPGQVTPSLSFCRPHQCLFADYFTQAFVFPGNSFTRISSGYASVFHNYCIYCNRLISWLQYKKSTANKVWVWALMFMSSASQPVVAQ